MVALTASPTHARIILITGAAGGIGLACAQAFARGGDIVVLTDLDGDAAQARAAELGVSHIGMTLDVSDEAAVVRTVAEIVARFSRIDVLINNAGIVDPAAASVFEKPLKDVQRLIAVNLEGSFIAAREVGRVMLAQRCGSIVNLSSGAALAALPNRTAYSMTKAALLGFTRALACEWALQGVRVNAVLPGYVATEILRTLERSGKFDPKTVTRAVPLGRLAQPDEIAAAIVQIAGASYVTGAAISVDGGVSAFGGSGSASTAAVAVDRRPVDQVVIVTGGASGIGAAIADRFVADGAAVVVFDHHEDGLKLLGADRIGMRVDVTDERAVEAAVAETVARFGPITVLANNAGVADSWLPTVDQALTDFRRVIDVNLVGSLIVARAVARIMSTAGGGAIVNLSSIVATGGMPRRNAYCAAKAGVSMLTKSLACEWATHGIRVNAVAPGYIATPGVRALERSGKRDLREVRRRVPMGRLGEAHEIADVVAFLASNAASYMTGTIYAADGGYSAYGDAGPAAEVD